MPKVAAAGIANQTMLFPCLKPFNGFQLCWEPSLWAWFTSVLMLCVCSRLISHHPLSHCPGSLLTVLLLVVFSCWSTLPMLDPSHPFFYAPISSSDSLQWTVLPTVEISLSSFLFSLQKINNLRAAIVSVGFIAYSQDLVQCPVHHKLVNKYFFKEWIHVKKEINIPVSYLQIITKYFISIISP